MAENTPIEELVEFHDLDATGFYLNQLLSQDATILQTPNGTTYYRTIEIGDVSLFLARHNAGSTHRFVFGIDKMKNGEYVPIADDDFRWDINNPEQAENKDGEFKKLKDLANLLLVIGI